MPAEGLSNGLSHLHQRYTKQLDIFAFGLIILELATKRKLEASNCASWPQLLESLQDPDFKAFLQRSALLSATAACLCPSCHCYCQRWRLGAYTCMSCEPRLMPCAGKQHVDVFASAWLPCHAAPAQAQPACAGHNHHPFLASKAWLAETFAIVMSRCLAPDGERPEAGELLEDPFFTRKSTKSDSAKGAAGGQMALLPPQGQSSAAPGGAGAPTSPSASRSSEADDMGVTTCEVRAHAHVLSILVHGQVVHVRLDMSASSRMVPATTHQHVCRDL